MANSGILFIVSGPSGAGKSTLCKDLIKLLPNLKFSVSCTTRPPRKNEIPDQDYHFISPEAFEAMIRRGDFAEWAEIYGHRYGTLRSSIEQALKNGNDLIFDIDHQGAQQLKKNYPEAITIFLLPPSIDALKQRLKQRETDSFEIIQTRIKQASQEVKQAKDYTYIVINDIYVQALQALHSIVLAEKHRSSRMMKYVEELFLID